MTRPKGKLFALLAIFMAIGIVTATGAFSTVTAERTASAEVAGDASALVGLAPFNGPNGDGMNGTTTSDGYAKIENSELKLNLGKYKGGEPVGNGLNYNASTKIDNVFNVTNNGGQNVNLWITRSGNNPGVVNFYADTGYTNNITAQSNQISVSPGQTVSVSIDVDTTGQGQDDLTNPLIDTVVINAENP